MSRSQAKLSRRTLFAGAGAAGAVATVAVLLPASPVDEATPIPVELKPAPPRGGGYQLSEHVKRYYKTTRL